MKNLNILDNFKIRRGIKNIGKTIHCFKKHAFKKYANKDEKK